jgi:hypothetical protein
MNFSSIKKIYLKFQPKKTERIKLYSYTDKEGNFDYNKYKEIQSNGNKAKIERSWVNKNEIEFLAEIIQKNCTNPEFGICHGTRRGLEQKWFSDYLDCNVLGTEISDTANQFPNTIQWDFHEIKDEWISKFDFVYSNSFDHSYDPQKSITAWMKSLKKNGLCIIEYTDNHAVDKVSELDPFGIEFEFLPFTILQWSKGKFSVREIIDSPFQKVVGGSVRYFIIKNN